VRRRLAAVAACLGGALLLAVCSAQSWAVQTVAVRDFREARLAAQQLSQLGFDAYTEFTMHQGLQFVRVRVGCFATREAAEAMTLLLAGRVTQQAEVVEFTPGAPVLGCVEKEVGFLHGYDWRLLRTGEPEVSAPLFGVTVAGVEARLAHDGQRWLVLQGEAEAPLVNPNLRRVDFDQVFVAGAGGVALQSLPGPVIICPGRLIAQVGEWAIIDRPGAVIACRLRGPETVAAAP